MLLGQQGGGHQDRHLLARAGGRKGGAHRHLGLAEADVAADHAVHRLRGGQVAQHRFDGGVLVGGFLEREGGGERLVHRPVDSNGQSLSRVSLGLDFKQLGGHIADLLGGFFLRLGPLLAAQVVQRRGVGVGPGIAADAVQLRHRHIQAVALGVFDIQKLAGHAAHGHRDQPTIAAHAVIFVHDRGAQRELAQVTDDGFGFAPGTLAAARLAGAFGEELALGEHAQWRRIQCEAVIECGDGDG